MRKKVILKKDSVAKKTILTIIAIKNVPGGSKSLFCHKVIFGKYPN